MLIFSGSDSAAFINRFAMPTGFGGNGNFYWAYQHGPIFYVSMCTEIAINRAECDYTPGSKQYLWLESTLAAVDRSKTPWLVLAGHRPMYSSDHATDSGPLQLYIEDLLLRYKVDVEIAGHMHETELVAPVYNGTVDNASVTQTGPTSWRITNPAYPVHMTVGNLGAVIAEKFVSPQPAWSLYRSGTLFDDAYGYTQLACNRTTLHFTALRTKDNSVMWELVLEKL